MITRGDLEVDPGRGVGTVAGTDLPTHVWLISECTFRTSPMTRVGKILKICSGRKVIFKKIRYNQCFMLISYE